MPVLLFVVALWMTLAQVPAAFAHAALVRSDPADGAILPQAPERVTLTFNEPVAPLIIRLVGPNGNVIAPIAVVENADVRVTLPALGSGTHALSWRVVSADGHPVAGSLVFSVSIQSELSEGVQDAIASGVRPAFWFVKLLLHIGLFIGTGGAFFRTWLIGQDDGGSYPESTRNGAAVIGVVLGVGLSASVLSIGLQGLDALGLPFGGVTQLTAWQAGLGTAYGTTAIVAGCALAVSLVALITRNRALARGLSLVGVVSGAVALALSGHAGTVEPRMATRSAVMLHALCVAIWIGALIPLLLTIKNRAGPEPMRRFTRVIPYPLTLLLLTGMALALVQLESPSDLWATMYGRVLACKLVLVVALLGLAAANRWIFVPRLCGDSARASLAFGRSIRAELTIALAVLALVGLWRFTPPPRAAAAAHVAIHLHGARAMAQIDIAPHRADGATVDLLVQDADLRPLAVKEVTLVLSNAAAGIESMRRQANPVGDALWRIDDLRVPVAGAWRLRVEILISDFEKTTLEDQAMLPKLP